MITINLSEKQARELLDSLGDQLHIKGAAAEVLNQIDKQLTPTSTNQAEFASWKSERILPNIIKAWKRKHGKNADIDVLSPVSVAQYQLKYMDSVCRQVLGTSILGGK